MIVVWYQREWTVGMKKEVQSKVIAGQHINSC
jgi:hypothetical protein